MFQTGCRLNMTTGKANDMINATRLNEKYPEAYQLMLHFYNSPNYYDPNHRPADVVLMAIQFALDNPTYQAI